MSYGIKADIIVVRSGVEITEQVKEKISLFCDVPKEAIVESKTVDLIYEVPMVFHEQGIDNYIIEKLEIEPEESKHQWKEMVERFKKQVKKLRLL